MTPAYPTKMTAAQRVRQRHTRFDKQFGKRDAGVYGFVHQVSARKRGCSGAGW